MLKSERIRQQIYQRGYEQGCREARLNFEKTAYIERMRDAFKRGEDFSEPPPWFAKEAAFKTCPMCAEEVKSAARICRYCRYEFAHV